MPSAGSGHSSGQRGNLTTKVSLFVGLLGVIGAFLSYLNNNVDVSSSDWLLFHPERSHLSSFNQTSPFFEGWYYKIATKSFQIAIIPGVYRSERDQYSFIFMITQQHCFTYQFPLSFFKINPVQSSYQTTNQGFNVSIGENFFTHESIQLSLPPEYLIHISNIPGQTDEDTKQKPDSVIKYRKNVLKFDTFEANLRFENAAQGFPVSLLQLGAMGYYGYIPFLECYHATMSMDYLVYGSIRTVRDDGNVAEELYNRQDSNTDSTTSAVAGNEIARGYLEKDWGFNFPTTWIWLQSNHFDPVPADSSAISVALALARIPISAHYTMPGFLGALWFNNTFYSFATWTWTQVKGLQVEKTNDGNRVVSVGLHSYWNDLRLFLDVIVPDIDDFEHDHGFPHAPQPSENGWRYDLVEFVNATVKIRFENDNTGVVWNATSFPSAVEVHGDISYLLEHF